MNIFQYILLETILGMFILYPCVLLMAQWFLYVFNNINIIKEYNYFCKITILVWIIFLLPLLWCFCKMDKPVSKPMSKPVSKSVSCV
jgi:hypothetical protein